MINNHRKEKMKVYSAKYYQKHKEKIGKRMKKYYNTHKEKINKQHKHYRQEHKTKIKSYYYKCKDKNKITMSNLKINGCAICGYNKCNRALSFHHVNPKDKKFNLSINSLARFDKRIVNELNKCILLCSNCHREIHAKGG